MFFEPLAEKTRGGGVRSPSAKKAQTFRATEISGRFCGDDRRLEHSFGHISPPP